jgi:hypothetical protein
MRHLWKKAAALGFLIFVALWTTGAINGSAVIQPWRPAFVNPGSEEYVTYSSSSSRQANNLVKIGLAELPLPAVLDQAEVDRIQVYEKNAQMAVSTATFDADDTAIRSTLKASQASIFNEKKIGISPERRLSLEIGVHPDKFDALVAALRGIGHLESISVQQRDRTGDFRRLHAQRQSLKKYLESVLQLRASSGPTSSVDEKLKLEQRIQEIEKELQTLNVQLGGFLGKESFYHVYVTLYEYQPTGSERTATVPQRLAHAFVWALAWWCAGALAVAVTVGTAVSVWTLWPKRFGAGTDRSRGAPAT